MNELNNAKQAIDKAQRKLDNLSHENRNLRFIIQRLTMKHGNEISLDYISVSDIKITETCIFSINKNTVERVMVGVLK